MSGKKLFTSMFLIVTGLLGTNTCLKVNNDGDSLNSLLINEVCSHNDTIVYNDIGMYKDYVELYNNSEDTIDLSNFSLSDKEKKLNLYNLPAMDIASHTYAVIFIDKETAGFAIGDEDSIYQI